MKNYIYLSLLLLLAALNFNLFLKPLQLVVGGSQGVAIILNSLFKISPSLIVLVINILSLILCKICLSLRTFKGTIFSIFMYPLFIKLTEIVFIINIPIIFQLILTGVISGFTSGLIYKLGYSTGGINSINLIISKYLKTNISVTNFIVNLMIVLVGVFMFGINKGIDASIVIIINCIIIKILNK